VNGPLGKTFVEIAALVDAAGLKVRSAKTPRVATYSLVANPYGKRAIGRDDVKKRIAEYARNLKVASGRATICLSYAIPGSGKSDILSAIYEDTVASEDLVPIPVSFNSGFGLKTGETRTSFPRALALRIIFACFVDLRGKSQVSSIFTDFMYAVYPEYQAPRAVPKPNEVLRCIHVCVNKNLEEKKKILILLDELSRYADEMDLPNAVQVVKDLVDDTEYVGHVAMMVTGTAAITWYYYGAKSFSERSSGRASSSREIEVVEIAPANAEAMADINELITEKLRESIPERTIDNDRLHNLVAVTTSLSSGHHRTLEKIYNDLNPEDITKGPHAEKALVAKITASAQSYWDGLVLSNVRMSEAFYFLLAFSVFGRKLDPEARMPIAPRVDALYSKDEKLSRQVSRWRADCIELTPITAEYGESGERAFFVPKLSIFALMSTASTAQTTDTPVAVRALLNHAHALVSTQDVGDVELWRRWELDGPHGLCTKLLSAYALLTFEWRSLKGSVERFPLLTSKEHDERVAQRESQWPTSADLAAENIDKTAALSDFFAGVGLQGKMIDEDYCLCLPTELPGAELWQTRGHRLTNKKVELESYFPNELRDLQRDLRSDEVRQLYEDCGKKVRPRRNFNKLERPLKAFDVAVDRYRTNSPGIDSYALVRFRDAAGGEHNGLIIVQSRLSAVEATTTLDLKGIVDDVLAHRGLLFVTDADKKPSHPLFENFAVLEKHVIVLAAVHATCTVTKAEAKQALKGSSVTVAYGGAGDIAQMFGPSLQERIAARIAYVTG